MMHYRDL